MNTVAPETMWVSTGVGVESTGVRCVSAGAWYAAGLTMAADFAGAAAVCAFCFAPAPTTWQAIPFTSVSFGAKTLADVDRSRHSILTAVAVCCRAKATLAEHTNTRTAIGVFPGWTLPFVAWSTEAGATNLILYRRGGRTTLPTGQG